MPTGPDDPSTICGIDRDIIDKALRLIRDKYPLVDKANYFLETNVRTSGINIAITNQRDAITHLVTVLAEPTLSHQGRLEQVALMEEHLRRGIIDSYHTALAVKSEVALKLFDDYKRKVLTLNHPSFAGAPPAEAISNRLKAVWQRMLTGRSAKARNRWDSAWEAGIQDFVSAYTELEKLTEILEHYAFRAHQIRSRRLQISFGVLSAVMGVVALLAAFHLL